MRPPVNGLLASWRPSRLVRLSTFLVSSGICLCAGAADSANLALLTNAQQVINLGMEGARQNPHPVKMRAVVTFPSADVRNRIYVQDETAGIQITATNLPFRVLPGQLLEIEGIAAAGPFYVFVNQAGARLIGNAPLPEPRRTPPAKLAAGADFAQWVSITAYVYDIGIRNGRLLLHAVADEHLFPVLITIEPNQPLPVEWLDAQVELRGVTWVLFGANNYPSAFRFHVPGTNFVSVIRPGNSNVYDRPLVTAKEAAGLPGGSGPRIKVNGIVTRYSPSGAVTLQDDTGAVRAEQLNMLLADDHRGQYLNRPPQSTLRPGDRIELVGAPTTRRAVAPLLLHAEYQILDHQAPPAAQDITVQQAGTGEYDGRLVRLQGRLIDRLSRRSGSVLDQTLWLQEGSSVFEVLLQTERAVAIPGENNSLLEVTGICEAQPGELNQVRSFRVALRDVADVKVLRAAPPWLNAQAGKLIATAVAMGVAALGWILLLRRRVQQQEERITALNREADLETRYRELFESQPYMFYRTDAEGRIELCSPACERLLGFTQTEMAGKSAQDLFGNGDEGKNVLNTLMETGSVTDAEVRFRRKDGQFGAFSVNARTVRGAGGKVVATEGFVRDITARILAQEKARRSETMTRIINYFATSLLEQDTEETIVWDLARNCVSKLGFVDCVVYLVDEKQKMLVQKAAFGPKCQEGQTILNPIVLAFGQGIVGTVAASGKAELVPDTTKDARYVIDDEPRCSELAVPIVADGTVVGVIDSEHPAKNFFTPDHLEILTAIASLCANKLVRVRAEQKVRAMNVELEERVALRTTELKRANDELQQSEAHVRLIIDTALDGVVTMDANGLIQGWNAQAEVIFGWSSQEAIGRPLATTVIPPALRAAHERGIQHYLATGEGPVLNKRIEITALHRSGREFPVELTIAPMNLGGTIIFSAFVRDITERKRAEATLQENEIRLRVMLKHAPEAIYMVDLDTGRFVEPNDLAAALCGVDRDTLLKLGPMDVSPPVQPDGESSNEKLNKHMEEAMAGGTPVFEWLHRSVSGVEVPCEIRLVRMPIPGRRLVRYSVTEIRERKRAEKRREAFSTLGEQLSGAASVDEAARIIVEVSDHLFGWDSCSFDLYSVEQDRTFSVLTMDLVNGARVSVPPTVTGATPSPVMRRTITEGAQLILRKNPQLERTSEMIPFGDAQRPSASLMFVPIRNGAIVTGTLSIQSYSLNAYTQSDLETLQALADYCSAAIERIQAEHQFRSIFENAVEGICRIAPDGRFLAANPALVRMLGYESSRHLMQSVGNIGEQLYVDPEQWKEFIDQLTSRDVVAGFEAEIHRKDGSRIWISQSGRTVRDARRTLRHYEGTLEDITERKRVEHELLRALAKEKELGELKSNFVSMVSHEFRTPLNVIMSSGEILERYLDRLKPEQRSEHLQAIHKNVRRMAGLMEEVLLLTKVDAGKMEFKPLEFDLSGFCRRLVDEILSATNYQCPIHFEAEGLPSSAQGDEGLLRHIFLNLLSNAVKYSPSGTPVRFSVRTQLGQAMFRVEDNGLGIPTADQGRLFQAFYRGKNVEHLSGTGLGLVIVKRCVQLHGGKIHFQSTEGKGTIFTVWLPLFGQTLDTSFETAFLVRQTK